MSELPELQRISAPPFWHEAWPEDALPATDAMFAVGWLGTSVRSQGALADECVARLVRADEEDVGSSDHARGTHLCELCPTVSRPSSSDVVVRWRDRDVTVRGKGYYFVMLDGKAYVAPRLLIHYMVDHGYRPPDEFLDVVERGTFVKVGKRFDRETIERIHEVQRREQRNRRLVDALIYAVVVALCAAAAFHFKR